MARGTGPKRNPNKITIGDGSISDLIKFLVGEDIHLLIPFLLNPVDKKS